MVFRNMNPTLVPYQTVFVVRRAAQLECRSLDLSGNNMLGVVSRLGLPVLGQAVGPP